MQSQTQASNCKRNITLSCRKRHKKDNNNLNIHRLSDTQHSSDVNTYSAKSYMPESEPYQVQTFDNKLDQYHSHSQEHLTGRSANYYDENNVVDNHNSTEHDFHTTAYSPSTSSDSKFSVDTNSMYYNPRGKRQTSLRYPVPPPFYFPFPYFMSQNNVPFMGYPPPNFSQYFKPQR